MLWSCDEEVIMWLVSQKGMLIQVMSLEYALLMKMCIYIESRGHIGVELWLLKPSPLTLIVLANFFTLFLVNKPLSPLFN